MNTPDTPVTPDTLEAAPTVDSPGIAIQVVGAALIVGFLNGEHSR